MMTLRKIFLVSMTLMGLVVGFPTQQSFASGTTAGSTISNQATVFYSISSGVTYSATSNIANILVDEIVRLNVVWQSTSSITVVPGSTNQYGTLRLTNTGNGTETFLLTADNTLGGDQFDPTLVGLFLDSNSNGIYEPVLDITSADSLTLLADEAVSVFVVNDIPNTRSDSSPLQDGDIGTFNVNVTSDHGNGAEGTAFPGDGDSGGAAIFGQDFPTVETGQYVIEGVDVDIIKSATAEDLSGGSQYQPGATITYTLTVNVTGSGTAYELLISDPVPSNTTYVAESITLDSAPLSDATDADAGEATGDPVNQITVDLGDQGTGSRVITFKVTIDE